MGIYDYKTPDGAGDTFYQYVVDFQDLGLVDGNDYLQTEGPRIADGDFIVRNWCGLFGAAKRLKIYDWQKKGLSLAPMFVGAGTGRGGMGQMVVCPEVAYPDRSRIILDLINMQQSVAGVDGALTVLASQLVFSGVRRRQGVVSDPVPSAYRYYEKEYSIPYTLSINNYASSGGVFLPSVQHKVPIDDFDFELRRIELAYSNVEQDSKFKMQLYDTNWNMASNLPVLSNILCHTNFPGDDTNAVPSSSQNGEYAFWPSPPMLYRVNSVIRFDVFSLLISPTTLPVDFGLVFKGVRRIPC